MTMVAINIIKGTFNFTPRDRMFRMPKLKGRPLINDNKLFNRLCVMHPGIVKCNAFEYKGR
ncbi:hypothetical protein A3766_08490 [Oleiphilus sp. HI0132]|nr:hypothetical protein A3766_08490 [Oleiphilus sp. HI0132]